MAQAPVYKCGNGNKIKQTAWAGKTMWKCSTCGATSFEGGNFVTCRTQKKVSLKEIENGY